jgi:hypothetical protein
MDLTYDLHYVGKQTWNLRGFDATGGIAFTPTTIPTRVMTTARIAGRPFEDERLELAATAWNFTQLFGDGFQEHPEGQFVRGRLFGSMTYKF